MTILFKLATFFTIEAADSRNDPVSSTHGVNMYKGGDEKSRKLLSLLIDCDNADDRPSDDMEI